MSGPGQPEPFPADDALIERLLAARHRVGAVAHRTPVLRSATLDGRTGARVALKAENFQRMGAFKFRGAWNTISQLPEAARARGVTAFSSGNHAQAVALVARMLGIPAAIVMPSGAPRVKVDAVRGYGAEVLHHDTMGETREGLAARLAAERGMTLVPPFEHPDIVAGQGTAATELFEEASPLDLLLVPVGGGGLIAGCALAAHALSGGTCRVIGVEPAAGDDGARSFASGTLQRVEDPHTIADGARTPSLGAANFAIVRRHVSAMTTVSDTEIVEAMRLLWERMKIVVEPTGAMGVAALLAGRVPCEGQRVGVILSGGNVDLVQAGEWFARGAQESA